MESLAIIWLTESQSGICTSGHYEKKEKKQEHKNANMSKQK